MTNSEDSLGSIHSRQEGRTPGHAADPPAGGSDWQIVMLGVELHGHRHALEVAAEAIARAHDLSADTVFEALWRREQIGSTAVGGGVAIPHARMSGPRCPIVHFMRPKLAIDCDAPDGKPVDIFVVVLLPANGDPEAHLQLLALIAEKLSDPAFRARLAEAGGDDPLWPTLANWMRRISRWVGHRAPASPPVPAAATAGT